MKDTERMYLCLSQERIIQFQVNITFGLYGCFNEYRNALGNVRSFSEKTARNFSKSLTEVNS